MADNRPPVVSRPLDSVIAPLAAFFSHKLAGAMLLLTAALVAVVWANSPWADSYFSFLHQPVAIEVGKWRIEKSVHHCINDGLMAFFFFVVGLELKREILYGELSSFRKAAMPVCCAIGGMLVPAGIYALINANGPGSSGWGVPMATDIAFALGVLALVGDKISPQLKVLLTAIAVADDLGAVLVIACFYTQGISLIALVSGCGLVGLSLAMNFLGVRSHMAYFAVGTAVWLCFLESGVHATLAAVLVAFTIPARTRLESVGMARALMSLAQHYSKQRLPEGHGLLERHEEEVLHEIEDIMEKGSTPLQRLEHALMPVVTFFVLPLFALANAGVALHGGSSALASPVALGVVLGLVVGKPIGIVCIAFLSSRMGLRLPTGVKWRDLWALGVLAGIGFTMSLFVGELAFSQKDMVEAAKLGTLLASAIAGGLGYLLLRRVGDSGAQNSNRVTSP